MERLQFSLRRLLVSLSLFAIGLALISDLMTGNAFLKFWGACTVFGASIGVPFGRPWSWAGLAVGCMIGLPGALLLMRMLIHC